METTLKNIADEPCNLLEMLPMELINITFYYIDNIKTAINLMEIKPFDKLLSTLSWESLIKEKIGYLFDSLNIKLINNSILQNLFVYFRCIRIYNDLLVTHNRNLKNIMLSVTAYSTYDMDYRMIHNVDLFLYLLPDDTKLKVVDNMSRGIGNTYSLIIYKEDNKIKYKFESNATNGPIILNKEEYMKMLFYGYYYDF